MAFRALRRLLSLAAMLLLAACSGSTRGWPLGWAAGPPPPVPIEAADPAESEPSAARALCEQTLAARDWRAAVDACEAPEAAAAEELARAYLGLGRAALGVGDVRSALEWFERAHEQQPGAREVAREYALALAYRGGELALASGDSTEAAAKFRAVYEGDRLYLAWLPERAPGPRLAAIQTQLGRQQLAEGALQDAEALCRSAVQLVADLPGAQECLDEVARARTPTPTPTRTPTIPPLRATPRPAPIPVRPPAPAAAPTAPPTVRVAPNIPTLGVLIAP